MPLTEAQKTYQHTYYQENRQRILERKKIAQQADTERKNAYYKTPNGRKSYTLSNWKNEGLIDSNVDNYKKRYEAYIATTHCDVCQVEFKLSCDRCMDRDHHTNLFRQFLCQDCNRKDRWKKKGLKIKSIV